MHSNKLYTATQVLKLLPKGWRRFRIMEPTDSDNVPIFRLRKRNLFLLYYGFHSPSNKHKWTVCFTSRDYVEKLYIECVWGDPQRVLYRALREFQHECSAKIEVLEIQRNNAQFEACQVLKEIVCGKVSNHNS